MLYLSRFAASAVFAAVPFLFSGCQKDEPLPMDQEITGTATKVIYVTSFSGNLEKIEMQFADADGQKWSLLLVGANKFGAYAHAYEGDATISTDNFLRPESTVKKDIYDNYIETSNNQEYKINVNVAPGSELTVTHDGAGYKSFEILVPSSSISETTYSLWNEAQIRELYKDRTKLTELVGHFIDNVKNSPYLPPEGTMGFSIDLKPD